MDVVSILLDALGRLFLSQGSSNLEMDIFSIQALCSEEALGQTVRN